MAFGMQIRATITGRRADALGDRYQVMRDYHQLAGVYMMSQGLTRLTQTVQPGQFRTPGLRQSLQVGPGGSGGTRDTVFRADGFGAVVGSTMPHARIQQEGGIIRPVSGRALAIPLIDQLKRQELWPRDFARDALTFIVPKNKKSGLVGYLFDRDGSLGFGERPIYMLVSRVVRKPAPYLYFNDADLKTLSNMLDAHLDSGAQP